MRRRRLLVFIAAILITTGGVIAWRSNRQPVQAMPNSTSTLQAIPVTAGVAATANVPVYLTGLGTVQAFNAVTVKTRVDGGMNDVALIDQANASATVDR